MTATESDHLDDPFYGLGYTTPEQAEELHARRLAAQRLPIEHKPHPTGHVRDYESDNDPELMTMAEVREARTRPRSGVGREAARTALREIGDDRIAEIAAGDEVYAAVLRRARDARRQRHENSA